MGDDRWPPRPMLFGWTDGLPLGYIDAPWYYVLQAPIWAWELDREVWLDEVCARLGLKRVTDEPTPPTTPPPPAGPGTPQSPEQPAPR
jgi:hypothetical protein